jgi:uncharacterized phage-associated protein
MAVDAKVVANAILQAGQRDNIPVEPMKLQKLVFLAHGWHLHYLHEPLFSQNVEAWKYGPVIPSLYSEFKEYKAAPITRLALLVPGTILLSDVPIALIESVWRTYKDKGGIYLSMLTHEQGSAWDIARRDATGWYSPIIPNDKIEEEFTRRSHFAGRL